jgi:arsenate reductase
MGGDDFEVHSAGTHPSEMNPYTVGVLAAANIDVSDERSKHVSEYDGQMFDYVVTVCDAAAEECLIFQGAPQHIHWSFADPAAVAGSDDEKLRAFEGTMHDMQSRISAFIAVVRGSALAPDA